MLGTTDDLVGFGTLALAIATFVLAGTAFWQLMESRRQRARTERSLDVAEAKLAAQQRPELIAFQESNGGRLVHLATYGNVEKPVGEVWARVELMNANGAGAALTNLKRSRTTWLAYVRAGPAVAGPRLAESGAEGAACI